MEYNLEIDRVANRIKEEKAKLVCIQLPDGLKQNAKEISEKLEKETNAQVLIWADSCFGACDIPNLDKLKVDLLIQWGHSEWK